MIYKTYTVGGILMHHGVQGMHWGVHNGPPYPLDSEKSTGNSLRTENIEKIRKQNLRKFKNCWSIYQTKRQDKYLEDRHMIKKGTKMYRVTTDPNEKMEGSTYVSYKDADRYMYGNWVAGNAKRDGKKSYEVTYKLKEDLVIPSRKDMQDAYNKAIEKVGKKSVDEATKRFIIGDRALNKDIEQAKKDYEASDKFLKKMDSDPNYVVRKSSDGSKYGLFAHDQSTKSIAEIGVSQLNNGSAYKQAKRTVEAILQKVGDKEMSHYALAVGTLTANPKLKEEMISILKSKGFNAMVDEAGVGSISTSSGYVNREGVEPLIIFSKGDSLKTKKTKEKGYDPTNMVYYYSTMNALSKSRKNF